MVTFVTTNEGKIREAREYLDGPVDQLSFDYVEPQADDHRTIAAYGARAAYRKTGEPVFVDDSGLHVEALGGFPGPYSSFVYHRLGIERVAEMAAREEDRSAAFHAVIAYCDGEGFDAAPETASSDGVLAAEGGDGETGDTDPLPVKCFEGVVPGTIVEPRGEGGFGYDPIFEYDGRTFAEMPTDEKNAISHRGRALAAFAEWYETERRDGD